MTDRLLSDLCAELQPIAQRFLDKCQEAGIDAFLTTTYRSTADQNADYALGRTLPGKRITNAKGGQSAHNCTNVDGSPGARAFDFAIKDETGVLDWQASDPAWQAAVKIGQALGLVSGASWGCGLKDYPHLELSDWRAI